MADKILDSREIMNNIGANLKELIFSTNATNACLVTEDGLLIINLSAESTESTNYDDQNDDLASISASLLSIVEGIVGIFKDNYNLSQFVINTNTSFEDREMGSYIIVKQIIHNVFLAITVPKCPETGLLYFEIDKSAQNLKNIIEQQDKLFYSFIQNELGTMI